MDLLFEYYNDIMNDTFYFFLVLLIFIYLMLLTFYKILKSRINRYDKIIDINMIILNDKNK